MLDQIPFDDYDDTTPLIESEDTVASRPRLFWLQFLRRGENTEGDSTDDDDDDDTTTTCSTTTTTTTTTDDDTEDEHCVSDL